MNDHSSESTVAPSPVKAGDHVFLVDGSGYIFRAYFAMFKASQARGTSFTRSDGTPTGAVMTFCNMLWKLVREGLEVQPTHLAIIFDASERTFRNELYADYKANRDAPPEDLVPQFPLIREAVRAFGLTPVEQAGFEADDLIATYACQATRAGADVTIISGDKDLMQMVGPNVRMYDPMPGNERRIDESEVVKRFGVLPDKVVEVQALAGDSTDNIPGVPGIGVKTAAQLIEEYGDVENLLAHAEEIKQPKRRENLIQFAEQARISRKLVELKRDVDVAHPLEEFGVREVDGPSLVAFCKAMEFTTFTKRVADALGLSVDDIEAQVTLAAATPEPVAALAEGEAASPATLAAHHAAEMADIPCDRAAYVTVTEVGDLAEWVAAARDQGYVAFDTETNSLDAMQAKLVGVSLALSPNRACYVPLQHGGGDGLDLDGIADTKQIPLAEALATLKPLLEDESVLKIGQNLKFDIAVMAQHGVTVAPIDDTMLISYALDAGRTRHGMDELAQQHLSHSCIAFKDIAGSGKAALTFDRIPIPKATEYAAEDADITLRLWHILKPRLAAESMASVYETLERPLAPVLAQMEREGVKVDRQILSRLSGSFAQKLGALEDEIQKTAGAEFNVASPRQLGEILFDKMGLRGGKRTKSGQWETRAGLLDDLVARDDLDEHARAFIIQMLEWRQLSKLKSTYTDALQTYIDPDTGRIHTSYSMAATSTGRLASTEPNLQNIPIRTAEGRQIRAAFIAEPGNKLISADYSQIELRVLAHMADIAALKQAFEDGLDIHAMTASEMFGVPVKDMPGEIRRRAKAINFGIIYGISAFGLAAQLGIPRGEAADYIKTYFERFPGIRDYMEATKAFARENGFVRTLFGRKAHFEDIDSSNPSVRGFKERAAINAPIQGTAADIIRRAMVRMGPAFAKERLSARMLLQVHDELVFEAPEAEVEKTIKVACRVMESSPAPAVSLNVPLKVDARAAANWDEAH